MHNEGSREQDVAHFFVVLQGFHGEDALGLLALQPRDELLIAFDGGVRSLGHLGLDDDGISRDHHAGVYVENISYDQLVLIYPQRHIAVSVHVYEFLVDLVAVCLQPLLARAGAEGVHQGHHEEGAEDCGSFDPTMREALLLVSNSDDNARNGSNQEDLEHVVREGVNQPLSDRFDFTLCLGVVSIRSLPLLQIFQVSLDSNLVFLLSRLEGGSEGLEQAFQPSELGEVEVARLRLVHPELLVVRGDSREGPVEFEVEEIFQVLRRRGRNLHYNI
mmetsp:Transcript_28011/g.42353  ORF Transcript_28011/g.42353 Transcript_28011/m.42353 type:complete len:275 (+) Transcript_28011:1865-2689(+)